MKTKIDEEMSSSILKAFKSAKEKLKRGMDDGPEGPDVTLTTTEATIIYKAFFAD